MGIEWTTDVVIFGAIAIVSVIALLLSSLLGELFEFGADLFGDADGPFATSSSTVFAFLSAFGAIGWLAVSQFGMGGLPAAGIGAVGGLIIAVPVSMLVRMMRKNEATTNYSFSTAVGSTVVVTLAIPEGGVGRVQVLVPGQPSQSLPARPARGNAGIREGARVRIEQIVGGVAYVVDDSEEARAPVST